MEKRIQVENLGIFYREKGRGEPLLLLHGWGKSGEDFITLQELLADDFRTFAVDLPAFGQSSPPTQVWGVSDYSSFVQAFVEKLGLKEFSLLGHSFGGRVAISLAAFYPKAIRKLVLTGVPVLRRNVLKRFTFGLVAKLGRVLFFVLPFSFEKPAKRLFYFLIGERDYYRTDGIQKKIFKKAISYQAEKDLKKIEASTLIIWGEKDRMTPLPNAYYLQKKIKNSELQIVFGASHKLPYENPEIFAQKIIDFWHK